VKRIVRQFVFVFSALAALAVVSPTEGALAASSTALVGSVGGLVSDSAGRPQPGVAVELLYADSTLAARVFTDAKGLYRFPAVISGQYGLKALSASYLPTLKQNLRIRANTVVNLTLNSLYDVMQWTPQPRRARPQGQDDDWSWTLRTSESRPLLRWQEDGSPILVWDGSGETKVGVQRQMRARLKAIAGDRRFGEGGTQLSGAMVEQNSARRRMAMNAEIAPDTAGIMDAMLGFREEMTNSGMGSSSVQTVAAISNDPRVQQGSQQGLQTASLRSWESLEVLDALEAEAGSEQVLARVGDGGTIFAALPFAKVTLHHGGSALEYSVATSRSAAGGASELEPARWLPVVSARNGALVMEHGLHQELGWSTSAGPAEMRLVVYGDDIENPMIEGAGRLTAGATVSQWLLVDGASGLLRATGPNYSTTGMLASVESQLPGHNRIKLSYASGDALVLHSSTRPADVSAILAGAHTRRAQMYSLALSGTSETTGTRWRASYRWQPEETVTEVAPFAVDASEPYLNIYIRQPIHLVRVNREGPGGLEAQVDLRNLLAEGYQPFLTSDGSHLYFAQAERCVTGGLAFNF
jgi:hypothetical protein